MRPPSDPDSRILVCGSRYWDDYEIIRRFLAFLYLRNTVIHGGAPGADSIAAKVALDNRARVICFEADWDRHGKAAGPIRNQQMLDEGYPDVCIAFGRGRGTDDMVRRAIQAGLPTYRVVREHPLTESSSSPGGPK